MDAKEEVRARLNIEDIIGEYVTLKRAGRNFKGLSPFSSEKTPSFFVSPEKNIWHDFSSNKGGDIFSFIMEVEGLDFRGSLEYLANKAGVDLSLYEKSGDQELARYKKRLVEAHRLAAQYYQHSLLSNKPAMNYVFQTRQLDKHVFESFQLGYAPDTGRALVAYLTKKNYTPKELSDAGLVNRYGGDMFRGRMMVPLMDGSGQVVGFTGRIITAVENAPKYLNTPQTLLYDKGRHIFGLSQAKPGIRSANYVVIVEGNLDVISSHQAGIAQVVATAGTAMTEHHLRAIKRLTTDVRLAYDADSAGAAATERAIGIAGALGLDLSVVTLPEGAKDPDELIRGDREMWRRCIETPTPAIDWLLMYYKAQHDITSAKGKKRYIHHALALIRMLESRTEREHYIAIIAGEVGQTYQSLHLELESNEPDAVDLKPVLPQLTTKDEYAYQDNLLALACIDVASQELFSHTDVSLLQGDARQTVARYFAKHNGKILTDTPKELHQNEEYVKILLLKADARYAAWSENDRYYEAARLLRQVEHEYKKQKRDTLTNQLRNAEMIGDESQAEALRVELNTLIKEIARGQR